MQVVFLKELGFTMEKIFKLNEHIQRLYKSAEILDLQIPFQLNDICLHVKDVVKKQNVKNGYIRPVVWRGK